MDRIEKVRAGEGHLRTTAGSRLHGPEVTRGRSLVSENVWVHVYATVLVW